VSEKRRGRRGDGWVYRRKDSGQVWIGYTVNGKEHREAGGRTESEAIKKLKARLAEAAAGRFAGPKPERLTVEALLDALLAHLRLQGRVYAAKLDSHLKPVRAFFSNTRALDITTQHLERYQAERKAAGWQPATVNRSLEGLRRAFNYAARLNPPLFPRHLVPSIPLLPVDNVREGYFTRAEVDALLAHLPDADICDFIEWGFRTGMRKGEIGRLTWDMLDRSDTPWVLRIPGAITKNRKGRVLGLEGSVRVIIERRLKARRLDCPLIFHRTCKGKPGQPIYDISAIWKAALRAARLPEGRLFHDLRRSAVRTLIRSGVDQSVAMAISGHKTRSMLDRYNIITGTDTAEALVRADAYLSTQPAERNVAEMPESKAK
jgi:integrase